LEQKKKEKRINNAPQRPPPQKKINQTGNFTSTEDFAHTAKPFTLIFFLFSVYWNAAERNAKR